MHATQAQYLGNFSQNEERCSVFSVFYRCDPTVLVCTFRLINLLSIYPKITILHCGTLTRSYIRLLDLILHRKMFPSINTVWYDMLFKYHVNLNLHYFLSLRTVAVLKLVNGTNIKYSISYIHS